MPSKRRGILRYARLSPRRLLLLLCTLGCAAVHAAVEPEAVDAMAATAGAYVDQLIDPAVVAELDRAEAAKEDEVAQGRRFFSIEYQHYREHQDPYDLTENAALLKWGRETLDYGEFRLEALGRTGDNDRPFSDTSGRGHFRLDQYGFVIDEKRTMDNTLGVLRSAADPMIASSFRLNLSSTLLAGGQSRVTHDGVSVLYASAGRIGRLDTGQIQAFDIEQGEQYSLGYSRQLNPRLRGGAHLVHVDGSDNTSDHQSLASAVQYRPADGAGVYTWHGLVDSEGEYGLWVDGDSRISRWRHRYGLFRLEPELLWSDNEPNNDQQGGYLRSEMTTLRYDVTLGVDLTQTDIDSRDDRAGNNLYNGFVNGSWRRDRRTTVGGTLSLRGSDPRDDFSRDDRRAYQLSGFVAYEFPFGVSRLQMLTSRLQEGGDTGNGYGLIWDQDWDVDRNLTLSSTLAHESERGLDDSETSSWAALLFRHTLTSRLHWNGDLSYTHVDREDGKTQNTTNASLAVVWRFMPNWDASLRATYNKVDDAFETGAVDFPDENKTLLFNLRYSLSGGRPFAVLGEATQAGGHGAVTGVAFFDANGDGRRQAGERPAAGVFVYLDGRYQTVTDADGRYVFAPVPTGHHEVTLAQEDLPLPWGLLDEAARVVEVGVRSKAVQDFALQRLNE